jgi:DNA-binding LacI/PurR family transcriptional regulator
LAEHGRSVPGDVSVVGFDDVPESAYYAPPLTTIRPDFAQVGQQTLALLLARLNGDRSAARNVVIPPTLVQRDSVATR